MSDHEEIEKLSLRAHGKIGGTLTNLKKRGQGNESRHAIKRGWGAFVRHIGGECLKLSGRAKGQWLGFFWWFVFWFGFFD